MRKTFTIIALALSVVASAQTQKKWQGSSNRDWDAISSNWLPVSGLALPTTWAEGNNALFDDTRTVGADEDSVKVIGVQIAGEVLFNNSDAKLYRMVGVAVDSKISGPGTLVKDGTGELITTVLNELEGGTIVKQGMLTSPTVSDPNVFGPKVRLEGGTIQLASSASGSTYYNMKVDIEVPQGATGTVIAHRYSNFTNKLTGSGTLHFISRGERVFVRLDDAATNWKDFTGNVIVSGDTKYSPGYTGLGLRTNITWKAADFLGKDSTFADTRIMLQNGGTLYSESGERCYVIGELKGDETSVIYGFRSSSATPGIYWMLGGLNTDMTFAGMIRPVGTSNIIIGGETVAMPRRDNRVGIVKVGTGSLKFTNGMNYITGGVDIKEGTLFISNPEGTRSGTGHSSTYETVIWVRENGTLGGTGKISGHVDVTGTLAPGENGVGTLTIEDFKPGTLENPGELADGAVPRKFDLILREGARVEMELSNANLHDVVVSDSIIYNGVLEVKLTDNYSLAAGDVFQLFVAQRKTESVTTFSQVILPMTDEGWEWDVTQLYTTGTIKLVAGGGEFTNLPQISQSEISIYPNPSNGNFSVALPDGVGISVEVFNSFGSLVLSQPATSSVVNVSLAGSDKGLYMVRVNTINGVVVQKILVK